ncbi:MAG: hypothetical protein D4R64_06580 [Porphyromonadaceae bacterium]|nr:MAG: hypothetical protein D4R64_06580 [Porphyromonadaceae bacterium]
MENKNFLIGAIILVAVGLFVSCHEDPNEFCEYGFKKATVVYSGAPEVDGCGWKILIDSVYYHPVNLSIDYQISDLPILIKYTADPEEFRCGRGGATYQSIRITEIKKNPEEVGILHENEWEKYSMDPFHLDSAYVDDDLLMMQVSYSGGCRNHELNLWKLPPNALNPPPIELALSHDANGDMCEAYITRWLIFSLVPLRERGKKEIKFLLRGSPEMSAYFGTYIYKY